MKYTIEDERQDWYDFYRDLYKTTKYGGKGRGKLIRHKTSDRVISKHGARKDLIRWLDVGAGAYKPLTPRNCRKLTRTDPGNDDVKDSYAIHELVEAYGEESFDVVLCFDVLEHLIPEDLDEGIKQLWDVCRPGGVIMIAVGTDKGGPWKGRDVHLTQQPMEWWKEKLEDLYGVEAKHVATSKGTSPYFVMDRV